mgnify:CR=1 FL=1
MNIYIKRVKNTQGGIIETLWVNYTVNGKRFRKSLELENTKANYKRAENEILPMLKYKLMNGELNTHNKKILVNFNYKGFEIEKTSLKIELFADTNSDNIIENRVAYFRGNKSNISKKYYVFEFKEVKWNMH